MQRLANLKFLLALSLVLRLAFLLLAGVNAPLVGDELAFQQIAVNVAAGRGFIQNNNPFFPGQVLYAWQAPLYPLSLAVLYFFLRPDPIFAKLFGLLIGVATVFLTFDLARRIFSPAIREAGHSLPHLAASNSSSPPFEKGNPNPPSLRNGWSGRAPWLAALFVAVYPGFLTSAHLLLSETLFAFLLVFAFDLIAAAAEFVPLSFLPRKSASVSASPTTTYWNPEHSSAREGNPSLPPLAKGGEGGYC